MAMLKERAVCWRGWPSFSYLRVTKSDPTSLVLSALPHRCHLQIPGDGSIGSGEQFWGELLNLSALGWGILGRSLLHKL